MNVKSKRQKEHYEPICFTEEYFDDIDREHDDPMAISTLIHNFLVKWILVNHGSMVDIQYSHVTKALGIPRNIFKLYNGILIDFMGG